MSGTDIGCGVSRPAPLRAAYAMPGTEVPYDAVVSRCAMSGTETAERRIGLRVCYAKPGTETRCRASVAMAAVKYYIDYNSGTERPMPLGMSSTEAIVALVPRRCAPTHALRDARY
eukprot:1955467-Rhodomonas_salina.2